jgi:hypothetical protein
MYTGITTIRGDSSVMDIAVAEITSYVLLIKKFSISMGPLLNGYGAVDLLRNALV